MDHFEINLSTSQRGFLHSENKSYDYYRDGMAWASKQELEMFIFIRVLYNNKLLFAYVMFPSCFILSYILSTLYLFLRVEY